MYEQSTNPRLIPQPPPIGNGSPVWPMVIADMEDRNRQGIAKYGTPLRTHNGRDALLDAYQESLDQTVYLRQAIAERDTTPGPVRAPRVFVAGAWLAGTGAVAELRKAGIDAVMATMKEAPEDTIEAVRNADAVLALNVRNPAEAVAHCFAALALDIPVVAAVNVEPTAWGVLYEWTGCEEAAITRVAEIATKRRDGLL